MEEGKNIKTPPKESLVYGVKGDIDGLTYFTERTSKDGVFKESYYQPRSEEDKNRILEQGRKRREREKSQKENSATQNEKRLENKEKQEAKLETNQQISSQKQDNNSKRNEDNN